jgi:hypothetical protein
MKILLGVTIITCLSIVGQAQNQDCLIRLTNSELNSCLSQFSAGGGDNFCSVCANQLISYYRECVQNGVVVDAIQQRKLRSASSMQQTAECLAIIRCTCIPCKKIMLQY